MEHSETNASHDDVLQWLSRSLDGELPEREQILLADHIDGCPRCARVAVEWRSMRGLLREEAALAARRPPVGLDERIMARIKMEAAPSHTASDRDGDLPIAPVMRWVRRSAAVAAGILLLLGVGGVVWGPQQASATVTPSALERADPALRRVLERWQKGWSAPPSYFEMVLSDPR